MSFCHAHLSIQRNLQLENTKHTYQQTIPIRQIIQVPYQVWSNKLPHYTIIFFTTFQREKYNIDVHMCDLISFLFNGVHDISKLFLPSVRSCRLHHFDWCNFHDLSPICNSNWTLYATTELIKNGEKSQHCMVNNDLWFYLLPTLVLMN